MKNVWPTDPAEQERIKRLDEAKKARTNHAPAFEHGHRWLSDEQYAAVVAPRTKAVRSAIRSGRKGPRTWNEINSSKGGGRDFG